MSWSPAGSDEGSGVDLPSSPKYEVSSSAKRLHHQIEDDDEDNDEMYTRYLNKQKENKVMEFIRGKDSILQPEAAVNADVFLHELNKPKEELVSLFCEAYTGYPTMCQVLGDFIVMMEDMKQKKVEHMNSHNSTSSSSSKSTAVKTSDQRVEDILFAFLADEFSDKFTKGKADELAATLIATPPSWLQDVLKESLVQVKVMELRKTFPSSKFLDYCSKHVESIGGQTNPHKKDLSSLLADSDDESDD